MISRFISFSFLFTCIISNSFAQLFEGQITYQTSYKSKIPNLTDEQFTSMMGTTMEYFVKEGNYKTTTDGTFFQWQLYINKDNKLYTKMSNSPAVLWNDGAVNSDEVLKAEVNKGVITILGNLCDELVLTCKSGIQKYYFNPKLKVDPNLYALHKYGNWNEIISRCNSLPLKMIVDNPQFTLECEATAITPTKLEGSLFVLPADSKLEQSPYETP